MSRKGRAYSVVFTEMSTKGGSYASSFFKYQGKEGPTKSMLKERLLLHLYFSIKKESFTKLSILTKGPFVKIFSKEICPCEKCQETVHLSEHQCQGKVSHTSLFQCHDKTCSSKDQQKKAILSRYK